VPGDRAKREFSKDGKNSRFLEAVLRPHPGKEKGKSSDLFTPA